jgi:hypothetical protein
VLVLPFAMVSFILGCVLLAAAPPRALRARRARRLARSRPSEPWRADHRWDPRGARDDTLQRALRSLAGAVVMGLLVVPFNWLAFGPGRQLPTLGRLFYGLVTGIFDALIVGLLGYGIYLLLRLARHGGSALRFERFPFLLGERLAADLEAGRAGRGVESLQATLRCVEETYESEPGDESASTVCWQLYAERRDVPRAPVPGSTGWRARIEFDLPSVPLGTRLSARPPRYWELQVRAPDAGDDYAASFLLPVYEPPR